MPKTTPLDLAPREIEVIKLLAENLEFSEIGERLGLSQRTVQHYANTARLKLGGVKWAHQLPQAYQEATGDDPWAE